MTRPRFAPWTLQLAERLLDEPEEATRDEVRELADAVWLQNLQLQSEYQAKNSGYRPMDETRARGYLAYKCFWVASLPRGSEREAICGVLILNRDGASQTIIPIEPGADGIGFATDILHDIFDRAGRIMI